MSFAGHVSDMIRRNKENREMLDRLRGKSREAKTSYANRLPDTTAEEMDAINRQIKQREEREERYAFRLKIGILGLAVVLAALGGLFFHFFG